MAIDFCCFQQSGGKDFAFFYQPNYNLKFSALNVLLCVLCVRVHMTCNNVPIQNLGFGYVAQPSSRRGFLSTSLGINGYPHLANSSGQRDCVTFMSHNQMFQFSSEHVFIEIKMCVITSSFYCIRKVCEMIIISKYFLELWSKHLFCEVTVALSTKMESVHARVQVVIMPDRHWWNVFSDVWTTADVIEKSIRKPTDGWFTEWAHLIWVTQCTLKPTRQKHPDSLARLTCTVIWGIVEPGDRAQVHWGGKTQDSSCPEAKVQFQFQKLFLTHV